MLRVAGALICLIAAGLLLGAVLPRKPGWSPPEAGGVTIGIGSTLAHTELILPVAAAGHDWRAILPAGAVTPGTRHLAFSWGERRFFLATPTWGDLDPRLALRALFASDESLVHIHRLAGPAGHPIRLTSAQYRALARHLESEIATGPPIPGYGADDLFLPGTGRYSWRRTCNQWTADALAAAEVETSLWTPFAQGLMWRYQAGGQGNDGNEAGVAAGKAAGG